MNIPQINSIINNKKIIDYNDLDKNIKNNENKLYNNINFENYLEKSSIYPDKTILNNLKNTIIDSREPYNIISRNNNDINNVTNDILMLQKLAETNIKLEIGAKIVGLIGQAINRLVSMQ